MAKGSGLPRRAPRKRPKTPAQEYMERTKPRPPSHRRTPGDKMAASLRYLRGEAGRRARKAKAERAKADRQRRKSRKARYWERVSRAKRLAQGVTSLEVPSLTLTVAPRPLVVDKKRRQTERMGKRGPAPLLTATLAGEIARHLMEGESVAATARLVDQPVNRVRTWIVRGTVERMASKGN